MVFYFQLFFEDENVIKKLRIRKRVLNRAVLAIDPTAARRHQQEILAKSGFDEVDTYNWGEADVDNYIEAYDCRPPPIFIPLITLAEVNFARSCHLSTLLAFALDLFFLLLVSVRSLFTPRYPGGLQSGSVRCF